MECISFAKICKRLRISKNVGERHLWDQGDPFYGLAGEQGPSKERSSDQHRSFTQVPLRAMHKTLTCCNCVLSVLNSSAHIAPCKLVPQVKIRILLSDDPAPPFDDQRGCHSGIRRCKGNYMYMLIFVI